MSPHVANVSMANPWDMWGCTVEIQDGNELIDYIIHEVSQNAICKAEVPRKLSLKPQAPGELMV